jgi:hypothetical protein
MMIRRNVLLILAAATTGGVFGCSGQSPQTSATTEEATATATDALSRIGGCSSVADACEGDAGPPDAGGSCRQGMCSCLEHVGHDDDGGRGDPAFDGGVRGNSAVDAAIAACLDDLRTCAQSATDPRTCAGDAIACVKSAVGMSADAGPPSRQRPTLDGGGRPFPSFDAGSFPGRPGSGFDGGSGFSGKGSGGPNGGPGGRDTDAGWP